MLLIPSRLGPVLLSKRITYCPSAKADQVDAQEEGKHVFYESALSAVAAARIHHSNEISIGHSRWKAAGEQEHCG